MKYKFAIIPLGLVGFFIAIFLIQNVGRRVVENLVPEAVDVTSEQGEEISRLEDPNQSVRPAIFRTIVERDQQLSLRGTAEPDVVVSIIGNGDRRRQIRADSDGIWEANIDVTEDDVLGLSLTTFLDESAQVNGDELLLRVVAPEVEREDRSSDEILLNQKPPALILLTAPGGPSRIIQTPFLRPPSQGALTLGTIEYDDRGGVIFSGFSSRLGRVRVFGNDELIGESRVASNGRWFLIAGETLPASAYNIRVQLQQPDGVESVIEVSLERLAPGLNAQISPYVVYNDDIWHVRRNLAGGGAQYTAIFSPDIVTKDE